MKALTYGTKIFLKFQVSWDGTDHEGTKWSGAISYQVMSATMTPWASNQQRPPSQKTSVPSFVFKNPHMQAVREFQAFEHYLPNLPGGATPINSLSSLQKPRVSLYELAVYQVDKLSLVRIPWQVDSKETSSQVQMSHHMGIFLTAWQNLKRTEFPLKR